jgi:hypothetical protein
LRTDRELPTDYDQLYIIAGVDQETVVKANVANDEFVYTTSTAGDGTVPLQCVVLPTARKIYYVANLTAACRTIPTWSARSTLSWRPAKRPFSRPRISAPRALRTLRERDLDLPPYQGNQAGRCCREAQVIEEVAALLPPWSTVCAADTPAVAVIAASARRQRSWPIGRDRVAASIGSMSRWPSATSRRSKPTPTCSASSTQYRRGAAMAIDHARRRHRK